MAESKIAKFKMTAITKLNEKWMSEVLFVQMLGRGTVSEVFLCKWCEPILASVSEFERKN